MTPLNPVILPPFGDVTSLAFKVLGSLGLSLEGRVYYAHDAVSEVWERWSVKQRTGEKVHDPISWASVIIRHNALKKIMAEKKRCSLDLINPTLDTMSYPFPETHLSDFIRHVCRDVTDPSRTRGRSNNAISEATAESIVVLYLSGYNRREIACMLSQPVSHEAVGFFLKRLGNRLYSSYHA
jgi:DNA-directed RNA polymerase specialized sigma24 family protein